MIHAEAWVTEVASSAIVGGYPYCAAMTFVSSTIADSLSSVKLGS